MKIETVNDIGKRIIKLSGEIDKEEDSSFFVYNGQLRVYVSEAYYLQNERILLEILKELKILNEKIQLGPSENLIP